MGIFSIVVAFVLYTTIFLKAIIETYFFNVAIDIGKYLLDAMIEAVLIIVVVLPEGWPLAFTLALAFSVNQMKDENNLVRHLHACEIMGVANEVLSDKTGTLTQNKLTYIKQNIGRVEDLFFLPANVREIFFESVCINSTAYIDGEGETYGN